MLEIKPIQTKTEQENICKLCKIEFNPDCLAYCAREYKKNGENGEAKLLGAAQFRIINNYGVIYDLAGINENYDLEALVIMGRTVLSFIDSCKIQEVIIKTTNNNLPEILGFKKDENGVYKLNLDGYFDTPCSKNKI